MRTSRKMASTVVILLAILVIMVTPAMAAPYSLVCGGDDACRINLAALTPTVYPAGSPFFIHHGLFGEVPNGPYPLGLSGFALQVDGIYVTPDFVEHASFPVGGGAVLLSASIYNFPQGLPAGQHTFIGHWYTICMATGGVCVHPNDLVDVQVNTLTVTFN